MSLRSDDNEQDYIRGVSHPHLPAPVRTKGPASGPPATAACVRLRHSSTGRNGWRHRRRPGDSTCTRLVDTERNTRLHSAAYWPRVGTELRVKSLAKLIHFICSEHPDGFAGLRLVLVGGWVLISACVGRNNIRSDASHYCTRLFG